MLRSLVIISGLLSLCEYFVLATENKFTPTQIHLSYGETPSDIVVSWSTIEDTDHIVEYGIGGLDLTARGSSVSLKNGERTQFIHKVTLSNLNLNTTYNYRCGSDKGWSTVVQFRSLQDTSPHWSPKFIIYGDMGTNGTSMPSLVEDTNENFYDSILHVGDFAYDLYELDGVRGDTFLSQIEPFASKIPYMTVPGNHEQFYNFLNYRTRFNMPGKTDSMYYSYDIGPVHFIALSTEAYYFLHYGNQTLIDQYNFLVEDLKKANENRENVPWIITYGHRPMYCSDKNSDDCTKTNTRIRVGLFDPLQYGLEELFYQNGVDLELWAHEHTYERLWPVYNTTVYNGTYEKPYVNPGAPVQIISGTAGCREGHDQFEKITHPWSALRSRDAGYARMQVFNSTHLYLEEVSVDKGGKVVDSIWIVKDSHNPFPPRHHNEL